MTEELKSNNTMIIKSEYTSKDIRVDSYGVQGYSNFFRYENSTYPYGEISKRKIYGFIQMNLDVQLGDDGFIRHNGFTCEPRKNIIKRKEVIIIPKNTEYVGINDCYISNELIVFKNRFSYFMWKVRRIWE